MKRRKENKNRVTILFRQLAEIGGWIIENPLLIVAIALALIGIWAVYSTRRI